VIVHRHLDEARGAEESGIDIDPAQARFHRRERRLDPARHFQGVGLWELLDHEKKACAVIDDGVANQVGVIFYDFGHVTEAQPRRAVDRHACEVLRRRNR
jgi:hypothetical protein